MSSLSLSATWLPLHGRSGKSPWKMHMDVSQWILYGIFWVSFEYSWLEGDDLSLHDLWFHCCFCNQIGNILIPVTYNTRNTEIDPWIIDTGRCVSDNFPMILISLTRVGCNVANVFLIILCCRWTISGSACIGIISSWLSILSHICLYEGSALHIALLYT